MSLCGFVYGPCCLIKQNDDDDDNSVVNNLYKSKQIEVTELEGYSRPTYNKLVHSATTRSTIVGVIHKLIVDVDNTCTPKTCCGELFQVHIVEIAHMTLTMPTYGTENGAVWGG